MLYEPIPLMVDSSVREGVPVSLRNFGSQTKVSSAPPQAFLLSWDCAVPRDDHGSRRKLDGRIHDCLIRFELRLNKASLVLL